MMHPKMIVNKIYKNVYFVNGSELQLICELMPSGIMEWESDIDEIIRTKYDLLMSSP